MDVRDWMRLLVRTDADKRAMEAKLQPIKKLPVYKKRGGDGAEIGPRRGSR